MSKTTHIADRGAEKTYCGRTVNKDNPPNSTWPICKTCEKRSRAKGPATFHYRVDQEGWITNLPPATYGWGVNIGTSATSGITISNCTWSFNGGTAAA